ncbi:MAG: long-chain fatty acid--CoA ligase [Deltaproteobacteria bacterium]|nr:long-chain fatty acid--CoA ligase [Deltaproteobacteria bacterium]MBN2846279.1 long-chain fatty acid--CoA ligase [Deltaproteobacteria bacterium]
MYELEKPDNLVDLFERGVEKFPHNPLFGTKNDKGVYEWLTYEDVGRRVDKLRGGLATAGIGKGDAVGIIANNRTEWAVAAFATYGLGARFIPMYEAELAQVWKYIVGDSSVKVLFVAREEILDKVRDFPKDIPTLEKIYLIESEGENSMTALEKLGAENPVSSYHPDPDEIAVLIYTSGTTGDPKGVLLSHGNMTSNSHAGRKCYPEIADGGVSLSILPWAHSYGMTAELHTILYIGGSVGFMESVKTIGEDMAKIRPTWLIAVPRVFNKIYDGLWAKMNEEGGLPKKLFVMGVEAARKKRELAEAGKSNFMTNLKFAIADRIVFQKIRDRLGGRLEGVMTASAAMNVEIGHFFFDIGIPIFDCYGMTETSPAITMNRSDDYRLGSVGKPVEKVKVVIDKSVVEEGAEDGEVIVYGPNVMKGYNNKPEETKETMTADGGVRTGDRGRFDEDGFLYITGRIKEQYKLENGKFVFPAALEEDIRLITYVENAMVYGENRPYNVCIVIPDFLVLKKYAEKNNLPKEPESLIKEKVVTDMITAEITKSLTGKYGGYEIPKKYIYITENFTLENGTLTQTMKLKRRTVVNKYKELIEAQYT